MPLKNIDIFFEENPNPMIIFDLDDLRIYNVNDAVLNLYGYNRKEMLSLTMKDLRPPEEVPKLLNVLKKNTAGFRDAGQWVHVTKSGRHIFVNILAYHVAIRGKNYGLIAINDVTDQIELETKYSTSREILNRIIENVPGTFYILNNNGGIINWNKNTERISGYSHDEIRQMNALDFFKPEERVKVQETIQKVLETGNSELEATIRNKNGSEIPIYFKADKIRIRGTDCILGLGIDISGLKEAQQEVSAHLGLLQEIMNQSKSSIYIKDKNGTYLFANKHFLKSVGLPENKVIGKKDIDIINPGDLKKIQKHDAKVRSNGMPVEFEEQMQIGNEIRTYITTRVLLEDTGGKFKNSIFGLSTDITDIKRKENLLNQSLKEKQVLLAEIHHRVKNNLAIITGLLELQMDDCSDPVLFNKLRDSQNRIMSIASTHEILYREQNFSSLRLDHNILKLVQNLNRAFSQNVKIRYHMAPVILNINQAIPCSMIVNEVITNIYKHAFKDSDENIIEISLSDDKGVVSLQIHDNGIGLPDNFNIGHPGTLGLKLINTLKIQLDADMEFITDHGSTFTLTFKKNVSIGFRKKIKRNHQNRLFNK